MNVGVSVPLPAYNVDVAFMARAAEALGFESLWCAEHPIMPVHSTSRFVHDVPPRPRAGRRP